MLEADAEGHGKRPARAGATLTLFGVAIAIAFGLKGGLKMKGHRRRFGNLGLLVCRREVGGRGGTVGARGDTDNFCEHLGLAIAKGRIEGKSYPERDAERMSFMAGNEEAAARDVEGLAHLGFLAKGSAPAKANGKAKLRAVMLASVHKPSAKANLGGAGRV